MSINKKVLYTAIFGGYDQLHEPEVTPEGVDFVCFTDKKHSSRAWQIRVVEPPVQNDLTRSSRMYKTMPHRFLGSYETSVWVDGNILVRGDVRDLVEKYLKDKDVAVYNHAFSRHIDRGHSPNPRNSLKEELATLLAMAERGRVKDDPEVMKSQVEGYLREGYPDDSGILQSTVVLRRHNEIKVKEAMEMWWSEIREKSKRDQLSFNYVAWKTDLPFKYIDENVRDNEYFLMKAHT